MVGAIDQLQLVFYDMPLLSLQRLKIELRDIGGAATISGLAAAVAAVPSGLAAWIELHDDAEAPSIRTSLSTIVDALLALYALSEEPAPRTS